MTWDGKERRKSGAAAEQRARIDALKREWEAMTMAARKPGKLRKRRASPRK
jgi:hypothetical protein